MDHARNVTLRNGPGVDLIGDLANGATALVCAFCQGEGSRPPIWNEEDYIPVELCPVCSGTGVTIVGPETGNWNACRHCRATGKSWDENGWFCGDPCMVCGGRGIIDLDALALAKSDSSVFWDLLHPEIVSVSKSRVEAGHYADAVEAALKHFNLSVKARVNGKVSSTADGAGLMTTVFSGTQPILVLDDITTQSGHAIQVGYMLIFAGAMTGIRNPKAHANVVISRERAMHLLVLASLFMYKLDEAKEPDS